MKLLLIALASTLLLASEAASARTACDQIQEAAVVVAKARDKGVPEKDVTGLASRSVSDPAVQDAVSEVVHTIYTGPAFQKLDPVSVGKVVGAICAKQVSPH